MKIKLVHSKRKTTLPDVREKFWIVEKKTFSNGLNNII